MDFQTFIHHLPSLYQNWGLPSIQAIAPSLQPVLAQIGGASLNAMQLLNGAVAYLEDGEVYCEIGCGSGAHLIAALLEHPTAMAYAVESPVRLGATGEGGDRLMANLHHFNLEEQVCFCCQAVPDFFTDLQAAAMADRIGVYVYNGAADYRSLLLSLLLAKPFLAEQALIVVGEANGGMTRQAVADFLASHPQATLLLDLTLDHLGHSGFGYGLLVLGWHGALSPIEMTAEWQSLQQPSVLTTFQTLEQQQRVMYRDCLRQEATQRLVEGKLDEAEQKYRALVLYDGQNAVVWQNLGMLYYLMGKDETALDALTIAHQIDPENPLVHHTTGLCLERQGQFTEAMAAYRQAIALDDTMVNAYNRLGELLHHQGALEPAEALYRQAIALDPQNITAQTDLGDVLLAQQQPEAAINAYRTAVGLNTHNPVSWQKLIAAQRIAGNDIKADLYTAYALYFESKHEAAVEQFQAHFTIEQLETYNDCLIFYDCFFQCGLMPQAIACAERVAQLRPDDLFLQILPQLVLPLLYDSFEAITSYRQRYLESYRTLEQSVENAIAAGKPANVQSITNFTNFYLTYQGFNDRAIHECFGNLVHRVMMERYPTLEMPMPMPPVGANGKIRIGYIAEALGNNSETRWAIGWLKNHDRSQFEVYCYSIDPGTDLRTEQFRQLSDAFYHLPNDLDAICQQVLADQLHILVFLALGNRVKIASLAALRLAPVQCSAWGFPVTSGFSTIDYYLSSELMEPENGQEHYTEQLIRLPNIGLSYPRPLLPAPNKTRADFGLREDAIVYLSCQLIAKYLPQHDYLLAEIVKQVPNAQLLIIPRSTLTNQTNPTLERLFRERLQRAFANAGLNLEDHCVFLPGQDLPGYASLLTCVDVFLDTLSFSGGHTTLDAIAYNLPVVCCPGELMRGRQSSAILTMLGVTDTIAQTEADYIQIAVKLGQEPEWRRAIAQQIQANQDRVFEDCDCVSGLEAFYRQQVEDRLTHTGGFHLRSGTTPTDKKFVLHVGCGPYNPNGLPSLFQTTNWQEVRLDIDPAVRPDMIGSITDLSTVPTATVDAVYSSHNLEHVYPHEVPIALAEFYRVLKPGGFALITLPDIQAVAESVAQGQLEETLYVSPAGPIAAIDILYGLRSAIAAGNHFMAHRTAFTDQTLSQKLQAAGFSRVEVQKEGLNLWAKGFK